MTQEEKAIIKDLFDTIKILREENQNLKNDIKNLADSIIKVNDSLLDKVHNDLKNDNLPKSKMENNKTRKIQVYSNCEDDRLDYRKSYVFHHFVTKRKTLIEEEESGVLLVVRYGNFRFKTHKDELIED